MPAFSVEHSVKSVPQLEGLQLSRDDANSYVNSVTQTCSAELFCLPESDGTPLVTPDYPDNDASKTAIVESSFIFVAN